MEDIHVAPWNHQICFPDCMIQGFIISKNLLIEATVGFHFSCKQAFQLFRDALFVMTFDSL